MIIIILMIHDYHITYDSQINEIIVIMIIIITMLDDSHHNQHDAP